MAVHGDTGNRMKGVDEVDSPQTFASPVIDRIDCPSKDLAVTKHLHVGNIVSSECKIDCDDGYCSQDQMQNCEFKSSKRISTEDLESVANNNMNKTCPADLEDATGKILSVRMPPGCIMSSNPERTTFSSNLNQNNSNSHTHLESLSIKEISQNQSIEKVRHQTEKCLHSIQPKENHNTEDSALPNRNELNKGRSTASTNAISCQQTSDILPTNESNISREVVKRKASDDVDGDKGSSCDSQIANQKRVCSSNEVAMRPSYDTAPKTNTLPQVAPIYPHIQGQANWVVNGAKDCSFHIYQVNGSGDSSVKQHTVEWAGINIHHVKDPKLKKAFQEISKAITNVASWKRFARILPVSHSPDLEKDLSSLEACSGQASDKSLAVLLRWWKETCKCSYDEDVRTKLKDSLDDCGLRRMARDLGKIFE